MFVKNVNADSSIIGVWQCHKYTSERSILLFMTAIFDKFALRKKAISIPKDIDNWNFQNDFQAVIFKVHQTFLLFQF